MRYHLKLIKGLSYYGVVTATQKYPDVFTYDKNIADKAIETGYFKFICEEVEPFYGADEEKKGKVLKDMTVSELETFAAYKGVSLKGITKKGDIIAKLREELGDEETENEVDYGSPTIVDLQE